MLFACSFGPNDFCDASSRVTWSRRGRPCSSCCRRTDDSSLTNRDTPSIATSGRRRDGKAFSESLRRNWRTLESSATSCAAHPSRRCSIVPAAERSPCMLRRLSLVAISIAFIAPSVFAHGTMVSFDSTPGKASGYFVEPEAKGKHPGLIVIQEWWGLNDWIRDQAERYAKEGYVALAPDLYRGKIATTPNEAH